MNELTTQAGIKLFHCQAKFFFPLSFFQAIVHVFSTKSNLGNLRYKREQLMKRKTIDT